MREGSYAVCFIEKFVIDNSRLPNVAELENCPTKLKCLTISDKVIIYETGIFGTSSLTIMLNSDDSLSFMSH